MKTSFLFSKW